jgi:hypothetical protein
MFVISSILQRILIIVFASLRSYQVLEKVSSFRFGTENTPIIEASFRFVSISLPLLEWSVKIKITRV